MVNYKKLSEEFKIPEVYIRAFIEVECGPHGFDPQTGKIIIQFEPNKFKWYTRIVIANGVEVQSKEWPAFNKAFYKNPDAAMKSTSWGMMQVMGFHYEMFGFKCVGDFIDYMKISEENQVRAGLMFIRSNEELYQALLIEDCQTVARIYNGRFFYIKKYDKKLKAAIERWKQKLKVN